MNAEPGYFRPMSSTDVASELLGQQSLPRRTRRDSPPDQAHIHSLFVRWQNEGDQRARDELVRHFLPLAHRLAQRYRGAWEPRDDLIQVASLGLLKAIERHDPDRGTTFQAFAVPTILGEIKRYFRDCGWAVHVPRGAQDLALKVEQAQRALLMATGRPPTLQQLAEHLELPLEVVCDAAEAAIAHHSTSLDAPATDAEDETNTVLDTVGKTDPGYERVEEDASIARARQQLTERQRRVLDLRFIEEHSQVQIAEQLGISQMQVSRILRKAINDLTAIVGANSQ